MYTNAPFLTKSVIPIKIGAWQQWKVAEHVFEHIAKFPDPVAHGNDET